MHEDIQLVLDGGHGGRDCGAIGFGKYEKDYTLEMALKLQIKLKEILSKVILTRYDDTTFDLMPRTAYVRDSAAAFNGKTICLSLHLNAFTSPEANGAEVIYSVNSSPKLAECILKNILELGMASRGVKTHVGKDGRDYLAMNRNTGKAQTVTIEPLFITNEKDFALLNSEGFMDKIVNKIALGLFEYLEIKQETTLIESITNIQKCGIIQSPDYWLQNAVEGKTCNGEYVQNLIKNFNKYVKENKIS